MVYSSFLQVICLCIFVFFGPSVVITITTVVHKQIFFTLKKAAVRSAIYVANTVAIFPLSEKVVNDIEQPEDMGHVSTDVTNHYFPPYGDVDAAVAVKAQEEGEGRDEKRK